jgi:hypothetical protein
MLGLSRGARLLIAILLCALYATDVSAQRSRKRLKNEADALPMNQPPSLLVGFSVGAGGQQLWTAPSVDIHYADLTLRTVPGPFYFGGGLQYRFGKTIRATDCNHRPIYVSLGYLDDWLLSPLLRGSQSTLETQGIWVAMAGLRRNLNPRGTTYFEWGVGISRFSELRRVGDLEGSRSYFAPMIELRLGLIQPKPKKQYGWQ